MIALESNIDLILNGLLLEKATIHLSERDITNTTFVTIYNQVEAIKFYWQTVKETPLTRVKLIINSGGGSVHDMWAICDYFKELQQEGILVDTKCYGECYSAATLLIANGTGIRSSSKSCSWMIHQIRIDEFSGDTTQFKTMEKEMNTLQEKMLQNYASLKTTKPKDIKERLALFSSLTSKGDYFMTAEEALKLKLIDKID